MRPALQLAALATILAIACALIPPVPPQDVAIGRGHYHLGDDEVTDWPEASAVPVGTRLDLTFPAAPLATECTLVLTQRDVDADWTVQLNGRDVARLRKVKAVTTLHYPIPADVLVQGENHLAIVPATIGDDIVVGELKLLMRPLREALNLGRVSVRIRNADGGGPVPARLSVTDATGAAAPIYYAEAPLHAVRDGIAYTANGAIDLEVPAGAYRIAATRGMEWSLAQADVVVVAGGAQDVLLTLDREVDTTGFVSADTHIHTLTYSGHGDSSVEERLVTLAGEGIELAIATDHNHNTDYRPVQGELRLGEHFTPVVGNEVTTDNGHFNAFPLDPGDAVPPYKVSDWTTLIEGIRARGAQVVILNHPRWPDQGHPLEKFGFEPIAGDRTSGPEAFTFDAWELINSDSLLDDPRTLMQDWFALLDRGRRITVVGSSDSHAVGVIVGQGRTYVASSTDRADAIDVNEAVQSFRSGRTSVSLGIFADARFDGRHRPGDTLTVEGGAEVAVAFRIAAPGWVRPRRAELYRNGRMVAARDLELPVGEPTDVTLDFAVPAPDGHDAYLVCMVIGDGVDGPWWPTMRPYSFAVTNPVYLDVDGDGEWTSPRTTAQRWLQDAPADAILARSAEPAVLIQALSLLQDQPERAQTLSRAILASQPADEPLLEYARIQVATERRP